MLVIFIGQIKNHLSSSGARPEWARCSQASYTLMANRGVWEEVSMKIPSTPVVEGCDDDDDDNDDDENCNGGRRRECQREGYSLTDLYI